MGHKASMCTLHCWASPHHLFQLSFLQFCATVLRQVVCDAVPLHPQHMYSPSQVSVRNLLGDALVSCFFLYRSLLEILLGQKIWHIRLRHPSRLNIAVVYERFCFKAVLF